VWKEKGVIGCFPTFQQFSFFGLVFHNLSTVKKLWKVDFALLSGFFGPSTVDKSIFALFSVIYHGGNVLMFAGKNYGPNRIGSRRPLEPDPGESQGQAERSEGF
jgi:hypothetical protein